MPIYEYECRECGHEFEELMRLSEPDPSCPVCGHADVRRLMSQTSFQLKGSGWYATDYKPRPSSTKEDSDRSKERASAATGSTEGSSTESGSKDSGSGESTKKTKSKAA